MISFAHAFVCAFPNLRLNSFATLHDPLPKLFAANFLATLRLALPLVLAELGWMSMAIVDTVMVGQLANSATAMGAVSLGSNIFIVLALFGAGLLMGLDTLVSQAFGAGQREDCHRSLVNSIYLSIALTPFSPHPFCSSPASARHAHRSRHSRARHSLQL